MAVPARLARALHQILGDEGGDDLVNWMVQVDANRSELRDMMDVWNGRTDSRFGQADARLDQKFAEFETRIDKRFADFEVRAEKRFADFEVRITRGFAEQTAAIAALERRLDARITDLYKWSFLFWCASTVAVMLTILLK